MPTIHYGGQGYSVRPGETVLDCLLRNNVAISYSCKAGSCQSCLVKGSDGPIPEFAQRGIKDTLRAQGYFLACSCQPAADLRVTPTGNEQRTPVRISGLESLNDTVLRVRLLAEAPFIYFAGQFVSMFRENGVARSYSLASVPDDGELELHVRKIPGGAMSGWLHREAQIGARLWLQGPAGNCFYVRETPNNRCCSPARAQAWRLFTALPGMLCGRATRGQCGCFRGLSPSLDSTW